MTAGRDIEIFSAGIVFLSDRERFREVPCTLVLKSEKSFRPGLARTFFQNSPLPLVIPSLLLLPTEDFTYNRNPAAVGSFRHWWAGRRAAASSGGTPLPDAFFLSIPQPKKVRSEVKSAHGRAQPFLFLPGTPRFLPTQGVRGRLLNPRASCSSSPLVLPSSLPSYMPTFLFLVKVAAPGRRRTPPARNSAFPLPPS